MVVGPSPDIPNNVGGRADHSQPSVSFDQYKVELNGEDPTQTQIIRVLHPTNSDHTDVSSDIPPHRSATSNTNGALYKSLEPPINRVLQLLDYMREESKDNPGAVQALEQVIQILKTKDIYRTLSTLPDSESDTSKSLWKYYISSASPQPSQQFIPKIQNQRNSHNFQDFLNKSPAFKRTASGNIRQMALMEHVCDWTFDIIAVERIVKPGNVLRTIGMEIFQQFNVAQVLHIPRDKATNLLECWLMLIEASYHRDNPYHTSSHAADVMQATAYYVKQDELSKMLTEFDVTAALLSAAIHDVDHPGRNSQFLINKQDKLAVFYNDSSVLENHHMATGWSLTMSNADCNIFQFLSREEKAKMRKIMIDMVIATDMTKHFMNVQLFKQVLPNLRKGDISQANAQTIDPKATLLKIIIKAADISNPTRPWELCKTWAERIISEYADQTDEEKKLGHPLTFAQFDRRRCNKPETQRAFISIFVCELFKCFAQVCPSIEDGPMVNLNQNIKYWECMLDIEKEATATNNEKSVAGMLVSKSPPSESE